MTTDRAELERIERERSKREDELLLLLLALTATARRDAMALVAHGLDATDAIRSVVTGTNGHRGAAPLIARTMAQAHRDGYRRAGLMAGTRAVERADAGALATLIDLYLPQSRMAAAEMAGTIEDKVREAVATARGTGATGNALRRGVREAFDSAGYTPQSDHGADLAAEIAVVGAHNAGVIDGAFNAPPLRGLVTGLAHISIMDNRTTPICKDRHELRLPLNHPYWRSGQAVPPLHFRCRSALRVLVGEFTPSDQLPTIPPMPGFGGGPLPGFARAA
jgi:hypothetical protein